MGPMKNYIRALMAMPFVVLVCVNQPASAITAELAKKCRGMAFKAHPPAPIGSKTSSAKAQQEFYKTCLAKNGNME